jgi:hypothetical protein
MAALTSLMIGAIIAGTATSTAGAVQQGRAAGKAGKAGRRVAEAQANLLEYNADQAEQQAVDALAIGAEQENRVRSEIRQTVGAQRAGFAAQNVLLGEGSAAEVSADARRLGELDLRTTRNNAMRQAWGYRVEATDLRTRAQIARQEGVQIEAAGTSAAHGAYLGAAANAISGTGSLFAAKYGFDQATKGLPGGSVPRGTRSDINAVNRAIDLKMRAG